MRLFGLLRTTRYCQTKRRRKIERNENVILLSIASLWEITIKNSLKKLETKSSLEEILQKVTDNGFELVPILPEHLLSLNRLDYHHRDPFDRMIIAQGICDNLAIAS